MSGRRRCRHRLADRRCARTTSVRSKDWRIDACIGIAQGRALVLPGQDLFGDCVNIAAKLGEDLAQPGEILVAMHAFSRIDTRETYVSEGMKVEVSGLAIEAVRVTY